MKYYNFEGTLLIDLTEDVQVQFSLKEINVEGQKFKRLHLDFTNIKPYYDDFTLIPIDREHATNLLMGMFIQEYPYRNRCEIWWKHKKHSLEADMVSRSLLAITIDNFDIPKAVKIPMFFWKEKRFGFTMN